MSSMILDWKPNHDERSREYPMRTLLSQVPIETKMWQQGTILDQGQEGACVGFGWTAELLAEPMPYQAREDSGNNYARNLYLEAKVLDEWPGENYEGTSVLAGAKALKNRNLIGGYRWCFGIDELRDTIISQGPVVIGVPWYEGMYEAEGGVVTITGKKVGGHCLTVTGYDADKNMFRWQNSWGRGYGLDGSALIGYNDLAGLLSEQGEACIPMDRKPIEWIA
jgi:C1A family cysteine protease